MKKLMNKISADLAKGIYKSYLVMLRDLPISSPDNVEETLNLWTKRNWPNTMCYTELVAADRERPYIIKHVRITITNL